MHPVQHPLSLRMVHSTNIATERQTKVLPIHYGGHELECIRREFDECLRLRHVLITQGDKAVVSRYEEIVAGDVRLVVEWWPMVLSSLLAAVPLCEGCACGG